MRIKFQLIRREAIIEKLLLCRYRRLLMKEVVATLSAILLLKIRLLWSLMEFRLTEVQYPKITKAVIVRKISFEFVRKINNKSRKLKSKLFFRQILKLTKLHLNEVSCLKFIFLLKVRNLTKIRMRGKELNREIETNSCSSH